MNDLPIYLILTTLLTALGFVLTALIIWALFHRHRSPTTTFAWLLAILLIPYVGIPLYLLFGGRKLDRYVGRKLIAADTAETEESTDNTNGILLPPLVCGVFPPVCCVSPELVTDSVAAFTRLRQIIEQATTSIDICTYILGADDTGRAIVRSLTERAETGVTVRLLVDSYGSMSLPSKELAALRAAGGEVAYFMPIIKIPFQRRLNLRNHRKIVVVDRVAAMMGGMNLSRDYMGDVAHLDYWEDVCIVMHGEIAEHITAMFESDWQFARGKRTDDYSMSRVRGNVCEDAAVQLIASGPDVNGDPIHDSILVGLFGATERVWIVSPYVLPDEMLLKALALAAQRGVDVRLVTPDKSNHPVADFAREGYLDELSEAGVHIYFHQGAMLHGKAILIDSNLSVIGSANLDMRSMFFNFETAAVIRGEEFNRELAAWILKLTAQSREGVRPKNRVQKALFGIGRLVAPIL